MMVRTRQKALIWAKSVTPAIAIAVSASIATDWTIMLYAVLQGAVIIGTLAFGVLTALARIRDAYSREQVERKYFKDLMQLHSVKMRNLHLQALVDLGGLGRDNK